MKLPLAWLRDFVNVSDDAEMVAARLGACGFAVESVTDAAIDFEITANRPDCLSVYGLARETAAAFNLALAPPRVTAIPPHAGHAPIAASISDAGCGRYALAVASVTIGPSPEWLATRLVDAGVRPINNIVDITNYVMIETGHPMHAFDAAKLAGPEIHVRRARPKETIVTLDGLTRSLNETMLVIADRDRAVAIAGVMGGATSEVSATTTRVAFESAWFLPTTVRATSRALGLKTEASARFERGADLAAPVSAIQRALQLLEETKSGRVEGGITDVFPRPSEPRHVLLRRARLARLLGTPVPDADIERMLVQLGFRLSATAGGWQAEVPSFRVDVSREADLIEEVGRHWGFDRIPATFPALRTTPRPSDPGAAEGRLARRLLSGAGLQEAVAFTFIEGSAAQPFAAAGDTIDLKNPLSEKFAVLRPSLAPGLLDSLVYNRNRQAGDVRLFEIGSVFSRTRGERVYAGWVLAGSRGEHWSGDGGPIEFTDTKGIVELLAESFRAHVDVRVASDLAWLAPGAGARLLLGDAGDEIGWIGRLVSGHDAGGDVYAGELDLTRLARAGTARPAAIAALPRQPSIVRDLSIFIDERLPAAEVRGTIRSHAPATLVAVGEFDRYQGKGVPAGRVSLSLRLTFRDADRTLTDSEVQSAIETIVAALARDHGAELRGK